MPRIFDNIEKNLLPALRETINISDHADFCVGYFNLRGWKQLDEYIERWSGGEGKCCRLLVGMQRLDDEELRTALSLVLHDRELDNQTALRLKKKLAEQFRQQLTYGIPTNQDEAGLRRLAAQIKTKKVIVKLFLRHPLHAKLYLLFRSDANNPITGFLGSSNLTLAGLSQQGELNVDILDHDACRKLAKWFEDRWNDQWCVDISNELIAIIQESWAREDLIRPYYIYVKMAYHLSQEARAGLAEFRIPKEFNKLFEFQTAAVKIAAHHLNKRGGVLIGDVVGLGKTLMATTLAKIFDIDHGMETLIICPKNLVRMWEDYRVQYGLRAKILSINQVINELPDLKRFRLVLIDESHNLRNREGKRYRAIQEYIYANDSSVILLSATPYNKNYLDLSNQLRLFIQEDEDIGIRPDAYINTELNGSETEFIRRHQCATRSILAFEKSTHADDWRELMRLYMVRRTRTFIQDNYAELDPNTGRKFLRLDDGTLSYFPTRVPKTLRFKIDEKNRDDQYAKLYTPTVVNIVNRLNLPRYGLGNYIAPTPHQPPTPTEARLLDNLSRAGKRLMGFCRTNLFKRLESSGHSFIKSIRRHILRNFIYLFAIENGEPLPIGTQDVGLLDPRVSDEDADSVLGTVEMFEENNDSAQRETQTFDFQTLEQFKLKAAEVYSQYKALYQKRFKWLRPSLFINDLSRDLLKDAELLFEVLKICPEWDPRKDEKLKVLFDLLKKKYRDQKVLIFSQFADTVYYIEDQLKQLGLNKVEGVTGDSYDPTKVAWQFSPVSNLKRDQIDPSEELRVLIATDVLSEGQNLQDCSIVVNYDLPWAIIRLVQRAGRIDRIGQRAEAILCFSFLPAEGVERIISLRARVRQRLRENAEVIGTDEAFFEDDRNDQVIRDLFTEKSGILDSDIDDEVDLASYAYQIWKNAITADPDLQKIIPELPAVVYSSKNHQPKEGAPAGVLVYMKTSQANDALVWINIEGNSVTESQLAVLKAAECKPDTLAIARTENHHHLVAKALELISKEEKSLGGQLGRPSGARFRTYDRLKSYAEAVKGTLFDSVELHKAIDEIYQYPLRQSAIDTLNRQLKSGISDPNLAELVIALRDEGRLCRIEEEEELQEPRIICSLGLVDTKK